METTRAKNHEDGVEYLSDTMSYVETLPGFRLLRNRMTKRSRPDLWGASPERAALTRKSDAQTSMFLCHSLRSNINTKTLLFRRS